MTINLGDKVKDSLTGFSGIVVASSKWITGCDQFCVQPPVDNKGEIPAPMWFDEARLDGTNLKKPKNTTKKGGPSINTVSSRHYPK